MIKPCSLIICDLNFAGASHSPMIDPYKVGCRKAAAAAPSILVVSLRAGLSSKTEALNTWFKVWFGSKQLTWSFLLLQFHFYEIPMEIHIKKRQGSIGNILDHENQPFFTTWGSLSKQDSGNGEGGPTEGQQDCYVPKSTATKMREEIVDAVVKEIKQKEQVCCIFYSFDMFWYVLIILLRMFSWFYSKWLQA